MKRFNGWLACALGLCSVACSSGAQRAKETQTQERYVAYAGEPTDRFNYFGHFDSWTALSDSELVVWTSFNDVYLLDVDQPCAGLRFASGVGVTSTFKTVNRGIDSVVFQGQTCPIKQIRRIDYRKMQADARNNPHQEVH